MAISRRELLKFAVAAPALVGLTRLASAADSDGMYALGDFGNARVLHMTDTHAQLLPVHFREPSVNIGVGSMNGRPPHLVGERFLEYFGVAGRSVDAHAFTFLDFEEGAARYGTFGGFAHLRTLVKMLRSAVPEGRSILLDGGDTWQGSGLANLSQGADMVEASNLLGVDVMTGHFEFTYGEEILRRNLDNFKGEFLAQNVFLTEEAAFNDAKAFDSESGRVFKPYFVRQMGEHRIGIIGQAFPYVPVAHPKRFVPDWTFGIRDDELQKVINRLRSTEKVDAVILLSHNGMDVDLKLAGRVTGIDVILGGHTHDALPQPVSVANASGKTLVTNAGSNGKFLAVLDLDLERGSVKNVRYRLLPVLSRVLKADPEMATLIERLQAPHAAMLDERLAVSERLLYRRGNFNGTMDQLICDALRQQKDAEIALSPGFRWGPTVMTGQPVTMRDILAQTAITYPETYVQSMTGEQIKGIMEDVCDNLFNLDPYYQQGGDMVRVGGITYACAPNETSGKRIGDLKLPDGRAIEPTKTYRVAGWASVNGQTGTPIWETVASYLREGRHIGRDGGSGVRLTGVDGNPGFASHA